MDAPFTGVLKNFKTSAKKFSTRSKFQDISRQLLKFPAFQDNAQAWKSQYSTSTFGRYTFTNMLK